MRMLRDFKCTACEFIEARFSHDDTESLECTKCKGKSELTLSTPKYFGNSTGRSPSAITPRR